MREVMVKGRLVTWWRLNGELSAESVTGVGGALYGVSVGELWEIERFGGPVHYYLAIRLAEVIGVELSELLC